jgi:hypothetical protein
VLITAAVVVFAGCRSNTSPEVDLIEQTATATPQPNTPAPTGTPAPIPTEEESSSLLLLNQEWIEGLSTQNLDLEDVDEVFWHIFSKLPDEVTVYPSENYFYFVLYVDGRQIWGNMRLAAGRREQGVLSFAYFEFKESPYVIDPRIQRSKFFTDADGLLITELDRFTFVVRYNKREVTFNLHKIPQEPPKLFDLAEGEIFVMRTFDESGYQFFLLFNEEHDYLFWVLNEEELIPDELMPFDSDVVVGRRSGFAFIIDTPNDDRKVLAAIRGANATINNYYDGPFDQLADNYVDETNISEYLQRASPTLRGRIDKYGYFTDREGSGRVAVSPYYVYFSETDLLQFLERVRAADDPYQMISHRGRTIAPTPYPTIYPTPYRTPTPFPTPYPTPTPTS